MPPRYINEHDLQAREQAILDQALTIVSKQGLMALTMDKLVTQVPYSKGTVYNHFSSKEDVFAALCNLNKEKLEGLFERAAAIPGSARDKMTAIGFAYLLSVLQAPHHFTLVMNIKTEFFEKASEARRMEHERLDQHIFSILHTIIEQAVDSRELVLADESGLQQVSFAMWAVSFGTIALLLNDKPCSTIEGLLLEDRVIAHGRLVMDGFGWKESERDWRELLAWLKSDVFTPELKQLEQNNIFLR